MDLQFQVESRILVAQGNQSGYTTSRTRSKESSYSAAVYAFTMGLVHWGNSELCSIDATKSVSFADLRRRHDALRFLYQD